MSTTQWAVRATALAAALVVAGHAHAAHGIVESLGPTTSVVTPNALSVDIDLTGWESHGSFSNPNNSSAWVDVGAGSQVLGFAYLDLVFTTYNGSWMSEFVLSVENDGGWANGYFDLSPSDLGAAGTFGPASAAWSEFSDFGGPFTTDTGMIKVLVWETFDDAGLDALVEGGTLRIFYQPIPEPSTYGLMALGLTGLACWVRRRKTV